MSASRKAAVRAAFDRAASGYDAAALLQREIAARLDERLDLMKLTPTRVLDAGCGTGHALPGLRRRYPAAHLLGLDLAPAMLGVAARQTEPGRWRRLGRTLTGRGGSASSFLCGDLERLPLARASLDLVWSNVTLQWMSDLEQTFREVRRVLRPDGLFVFSTFGPDTLGELRAAFAGIDGFAHVNRFVDMHDVGDLLIHAGFQHPVMEMERITLTYADLRGLLRDLKAIGAQTVLDAPRRGLLGRTAWQRLETAYEAFRRDGRLPATYEVIYGHAWAGAQERLADGRQVIQMKIARKRGGL